MPEFVAAVEIRTETHDEIVVQSAAVDVLCFFQTVEKVGEEFGRLLIALLRGQFARF